jgi:hypothetical protein
MNTRSVKSVLVVVISALVMGGIVGASALARLSAQYPNASTELKFYTFFPEFLLTAIFTAIFMGLVVISRRRTSG